MRLTVISTARHIWPTILKINLIFDTVKKNKCDMGTKK